VKRSYSRCLTLRGNHEPGKGGGGQIEFSRMEESVHSYALVVNWWVRVGSTVLRFGIFQEEHRSSAVSNFKVKIIVHYSQESEFFRHQHMMLLLPRDLTHFLMILQQTWL